MKLFTIGDSISQGFMSGGAAKPHLSYNTLLAQALGDKQYSYLPWTPEHHLKVDLELIFRELAEHYRTNIRLLEWPFAIRRINSILKNAERYFERGPGELGKKVAGSNYPFHSVAVEGMDVADAWLVTPNLCKSVINHFENEDARKDNFFGMASDAFYRNAYRVLNPGGSANEGMYGDYSALDWLDHHAKGEGIDNTIVWLGANNALGTVIELDIKQSKGDGAPMNTTRPQRQKKWNLWHPDDFRLEYKEMMARVDASMQLNKAESWNVFVGTIPLITIAPIIRGLGKTHAVKEADGRTAQYFDYYTYFPIKSVELAKSLDQYLTYDEALHIDLIITEYNRIIQNEIAMLNTAHGADRYHVVDICKSLRDMAWKRNMEQPTYTMPPELQYFHPQPNTKYYHCTRTGKIEAGGIFSLDGIHPSPTGQGILAWEFLKEMKKAGGASMSAALNWNEILASDTFLTQPIKLMSEIYEHRWLAKIVADAVQLIRD